MLNADKPLYLKNSSLTEFAYLSKNPLAQRCGEKGKGNVGKMRFIVSVPQKIEDSCVSDPLAFNHRVCNFLNIYGFLNLIILVKIHSSGKVIKMYIAVNRNIYGIQLDLLTEEDEITCHVKIRLQ